MHCVLCGSKCPSNPGKRLEKTCGWKWADKGVGGGPDHIRGEGDLWHSLWGPLFSLHVHRPCPVLRHHHFFWPEWLQILLSLHPPVSSKTFATRKSWNLSRPQTWIYQSPCLKLFILKEISPEYSLEGLMLKLKLQYFGHLMRRTDSL